MNKPIRVLVVDDSAVVRQVISAIVAEAPGIEVLGTASDPVFALEKMRREWPDVITLDVEMPRMDGISFLRQVMAERPTPVVICSSLTTRGAQATLQALAAGAVSVIAKPTVGVKRFLSDSAAELVRAVRAAAKARPRLAPPVTRTLAPVQSLARLKTEAMAQTTDRIIAIGTSTGGTQALEHVIRSLPRTCPGIVVVQHMPERFTALFAQRLDQLCQMEVLEAQHGQRVIQGRVLIAPGGRHMSLRRNGAQYVVDVRNGPPVNRHRPSVDVLFNSVARCAGSNAVGVIMTGMGDDGARGLLAMREAGAPTIAQDEDTCVVYGMPREAVRLGAAAQILPLPRIAEAMLQQAGRVPVQS